MHKFPCLCSPFFSPHIYRYILFLKHYFYSWNIFHFPDQQVVIFLFFPDDAATVVHLPRYWATSVLLLEVLYFWAQILWSLTPFCESLAALSPSE